MLAMLPMMFQSFDDSIGYPSFISSPSSVSIMMDTISPTKKKESPVAITESTYTILPWRPFGTNPLGWAVSNVLLKGAEALVDLREPELTAL
jgi:hypothetical protein